MNYPLSFAVRTLFALAAVALSTCAQAQSTKQRLSDVERQVVTLERLLENSQEIQEDMLGLIKALQKENRELRNELDTLQFQSERNADGQRTLYLDIDQRVQALEASPPATGSGAGGGGRAASDLEAYQAAYENLKTGDYAQAKSGFEKFLAGYPDSALRANAQYWLAESLYVSKDFNAAKVGFQTVIDSYPTSRKLPDAWLKLGYCNYELDNWVAARQALEATAREFPDTPAARLANERLGLMDADGV